MRLMRCVSPESTSSSSRCSDRSAPGAGAPASTNSRRSRCTLMPMAFSGLRTSCATVEASSPIAASRSRRRNAASASACFSLSTPKRWRSTTNAVVTMPSARAASSERTRRVSVRRSAVRSPSSVRPRRSTGLPSCDGSTGPPNSSTGRSPTVNSLASSPSRLAGKAIAENRLLAGAGAAAASRPSGPKASRLAPSSSSTYAISGARAAMSSSRCSIDAWRDNSAISLASTLRTMAPPPRAANAGRQAPARAPARAVNVADGLGVGASQQALGEGADA